MTRAGSTGLNSVGLFGGFGRWGHFGNLGVQTVESTDDFENRLLTLTSDEHLASFISVRTVVQTLKMSLNIPFRDG